MNSIIIFGGGEFSTAAFFFLFLKGLCFLLYLHPPLVL